MGSYMETLPPELVEKIAMNLNMNDRISLAATCRRMEAIVMQPRNLNNLYLGLNQTNLNDPHSAHRVIPLPLLARKRRPYCNLTLKIRSRMPLDWVVATLELLIEQGTPPKRLIVHDSENVNIMRLYQRCRAAFDHIEVLEVWQHGLFQYNHNLGLLSMPKLKVCVWYELHGADSMRQMVFRIPLVAPLLETVTFPVPNLNPDELPGVPNLMLTAHPRLKKATLFPDSLSLQRMAFESYPLLESVKLFWGIDVTPEELCTELVQAMPNLQTAEVWSISFAPTAVIVSALLRKDPSLSTLSLHLYNLSTATFADARLWKNLRHLHIHKTVMQEWTAPLSLTMPALETLCVSGMMTHSSTDTLHLDLPNLRELVIDLYGDVINVARAPRLEKLQFYYERVANELDFMTQPMPNLQELIVQVHQQCRMFDILGTKCLNLKHLTIDCLDYDMLDRFVYRLNKVTPALETLTIMGNECFVVLQKPTLVNLLKLPCLRELHLSRVNLLGRATLQVRLPDTLTMLTLREFCMDNLACIKQSRAVTFPIFERDISGVKLYNCNEHRARRSVNVLKKKCPYIG
uniref:F-box domain-containing protein n=1 Tax=Anopheles farauti TaxID=69004 RepID=A0A182QLA1_9DIPT